MIAGNIRTLGFNHENICPPPEINPLYGTESTAWLHIVSAIRTKCFWFHAALYVARWFSSTAAYSRFGFQQWHWDLNSSFRCSVSVVTQACLHALDNILSM